MNTVSCSAANGGNSSRSDPGVKARMANGNYPSQIQNPGMETLYVSIDPRSRFPPIPAD